MPDLAKVLQLDKVVCLNLITDCSQCLPCPWESIHLFDHMPNSSSFLLALPLLPIWSSCNLSGINYPSLTGLESMGKNSSSKATGICTGRAMSLTLVLSPACGVLPSRATNGSGTSPRVRIWVWNKPLTHWRCRFSTNQNFHLGYSLIIISQKDWFGLVVSGSPSGCFHRFIYGSWFCSLLLESYRNRVFNIQQYIFAWFAVCNIDWFRNHVLPLIYCIFAY